MVDNLENLSRAEIEVKVAELTDKIEVARQKWTDEMLENRGTTGYVPSNDAEYQGLRAEIKEAWGQRRKLKYLETHTQEEWDALTQST